MRTVYKIILSIMVMVNLITYFILKQEFNTFEFLGLIVFGIFQWYMYENKHKGAAISCIIIDLLQIIIFIKLKLYGSMFTYIFGTITSINLFINGEDDHIEQINLNKQIYVIIGIFILSTIAYYISYTYFNNTFKGLQLVLDFSSIVVIPLAYYMQSKQIKEQYYLWVFSDLTTLILVILVFDLYSVIIFGSYLLFDSWNLIHWFKKYKIQENKQSDEKQVNI